LPSPDRSLEVKELQQSVVNAVKRLPSREKEVIKLICGVGDDENAPRDTFSYTEVAKAFGVTSERIRQIESRATRRLQKIMTSDGLEYEDYE
jgi:RNA polymerase sigma factor (sigma-70 family)